MIAFVNQNRQQTGGLPPLTENATLDWAARKHSIVMAASSTMTHDGWDAEIAESHFVPGPPGATGQNIAWMTGGFAPRLDRVDVLQRDAAQRRSPAEHLEHDLPPDRDRLHHQQHDRRVLVDARLRELTS